MITIVLPIIFLIIMLIFLILFLFLGKRQETTLKTMDRNGKIREEKKDNNSYNLKQSNEKKNVMRREDVFKFMEFDKILNNMIVQNGGSRFTMAVKCKGINYDLMSEVEQLSVEEGFITFLNTLKYPIQLYVQAQNIDLKGVIEKYKENIEGISKKYDDVNRKYSKLASAFDVDERKLENLAKERDSITNVYEYANDMINYVERMSGNKNLLQRNFYVLVSYSTAEIAAVDKFNKDEIVEMCFTELNTRCQAIISALSSCSVSGKILDSNELADLLYSAYNRDDKGLINVREALDSGIFRLYSTSEDAIYKKTLALDEYLKNEAKIRALEAIKSVIENNNITTPASEAIDREEEISKRATNMIKNEDYDLEFKNNVNKKILNDFRNTKKSLLEEDRLQKQEFIEQSKNDMKELENLKKIEKPDGIKLIEKSKEIDKNSNNVDSIENIYDDDSKEIENLNSENKESDEDQPII